jgi:N-acetyl-anhydromuramyl-L-alanine amidase AmpD
VTRNVPVPGTALNRGLQDTRSGNPFFYGFENENLGNGRDPWPQAQIDTMVEAAAALCRAHCWGPSRVIGHAEWTSRKIDPAGIDMDVLRDLVRQAIP